MQCLGCHGKKEQMVCGSCATNSIQKLKTMLMGLRADAAVMRGKAQNAVEAHEETFRIAQEVHLNELRSPREHIILQNMKNDLNAGTKKFDECNRKWCD